MWGHWYHCFWTSGDVSSGFKVHKNCTSFFMSNLTRTAWRHLSVFKDIWVLFYWKVSLSTNLGYLMKVWSVNKNLSLQQSLIKYEISQNLTLSHVTTVSTNQNTVNSQTLWEIMSFLKSSFLKSKAVYNSSAKTLRVKRLSILWNNCLSFTTECISPWQNLK